MAQTLIIGPALVLGLAIGIYEWIIIHRDVDKAFQSQALHGTQSVITALLFTLATMNAEFVLNAAPALKGIPIVGTALGLHIALGLIAAIKIHGLNQAKAARGISGIHGGETWFHSILIGALIAAAPYIYPIIEPQVPAYLKF